jgi:hypothetical protein
VPKILFLRADEIGLVRAYHLVWRTPEFTLQILGVAQMLVGLWLIIGIAERAAGFYRHPLDVDPYRASREWKSVDANRSARRAGEGFLSHRVCDHRLDTRTNRGELRKGSRMGAVDELNDSAPMLPGFEDEFQD